MEIFIVWQKTYLDKLSFHIVTFLSQLFHVVGYWKIPTQICIVSADTIIRAKILGKRLRNGFSNYIYLKNMYITLKGIGKILFVSLLRILLICKFLNFTAVFIKTKLTFSEFAYDSPCEKVNFSLIHLYYHS